MRIPFDIKYRDKIESGEYKVGTRDGRPARVLCWDRAAKEGQPKDLNLCILIQEDGGEGVYYYYLDGTKWVPNDKYDLFIVTPKQEELDLTEFESGLFSAFSDAWQQHYLLGEEVNVVEWTKEHSAELLSLAREQFIKDGYVIEKKAFHDAVENISDKHLAEMSIEYSIHCKIEDGTRHAVMNWDTFQKVAQKFIDLGKDEAFEDIDGTRKVHCKSYDTGYDNGMKDALKDLPRWKEIGLGNNYSSETKFCINGRYLEMNDTLNRLYEIALKDLEKLPKEDEE